MASLSNRGQYDLTQHQTGSQEDLTIKNSTAEKIIANVIEPSLGVGRIAFALLSAALHYETNNDKERLVLNLSPRFCYYQIAVLPLAEALAEKAQAVFENLTRETR